MAGLSISIRGTDHMSFRSQAASPSRANSLAMLASAQTAVPMEFLVATLQFGSLIALAAAMFAHAAGGIAPRFNSGSITDVAHFAFVPEAVVRAYATPVSTCRHVIPAFGEVIDRHSNQLDSWRHRRQLWVNHAMSELGLLNLGKRNHFRFRRRHRRQRGAGQCSAC